MKRRLLLSLCVCLSTLSVSGQDVKNHNLEDYNLGDNFDQMERIAMAMPLTKKIRPQWDKEYLSSINAGIIDIVEDVGSILYSDKERINYSSTPLFMVRVIKGN